MYCDIVLPDAGPEIAKAAWKSGEGTVASLPKLINHFINGMYSN